MSFCILALNFYFMSTGFHLLVHSVKEILAKWGEKGKKENERPENQKLLKEAEGKEALSKPKPPGKSKEEIEIEEATKEILRYIDTEIPIESEIKIKYPDLAEDLCKKANKMHLLHSAY
jgi:hypothetical protein